MVIHIKGKTMLLAAAGIGMVMTAVLAAKNAPEAQARKDAALKEKRERLQDETAQLTFFESMKAQIGSYAPAIISGMVTLGSLAGSEVINKENLKKAEKAIDDYKEMTKKVGGEGAVKVVEKAVEQKKLDEQNGKSWVRKEMFRILFQRQVVTFESTRADVMAAIYETNRYFHERGMVTFNEFLKFLGQKPVDEGDGRGWECYLGEAIYGYTWIDFGMHQNQDEPWVTDIFMAVYPHFFDEEDCNEELDHAFEEEQALLEAPVDE